jgi:hypothetical protein
MTAIQAEAGGRTAEDSQRGPPPAQSRFAATSRE